MIAMDTKIKKQKECVKKWKLKFEDFIKYVKANKYLEMNKLTLDSLRENHKEFIKNNRLMLKLRLKIYKLKTIYLLKNLKRLEWVPTFT